MLTPFYITLRKTVKCQYWIPWFAIIYSVNTETQNLDKNGGEPHSRYLNRIHIWKCDKIKRIIGEKFFHVEYNSKLKEKFYQIKDNP